MKATALAAATLWPRSVAAQTAKTKLILLGTAEDATPTGEFAFGPSDRDQRYAVRGGLR